jgi:hypothetical protein
MNKRFPDDYRKKLMDWVENEEYLPPKEMKFKCLVQALDRSEQAAWEEVEGLKVVNRSQSRYTEEMQSRAHHYQVLSDKLQEQLQYALNALQFYAANETYDVEHLNKHGYIIIDSDGGALAKVAIQRIREGKVHD